MKRNYENRVRYYLPRRTYTIIRLDGRAFHTYTRHLAKPFDEDLITHLQATARTLCHEVSGTCLAYLQSDEISLVVTDFRWAQTEAWFDGNVQKIASVTASIATAYFNRLRPNGPVAMFDSRVFTIPDPCEVANYLIWRQRDWVRNSIRMLGGVYLSHREMEGLNGGEIQELLFHRHGVNWNDTPDHLKRGSLLRPITSTDTVTYQDRKSGESRTVESVVRRQWEAVAAPHFTVDSRELHELIPNLRLSSTVPPHLQLQEAITTEE
jgi:tRNA(His) 5'-end guanylyltransferase